VRRAVPSIDRVPSKSSAVYHHLLVPIDDTDLSVDVVGNAVAFARTLAARITFFHAVPDAAADLLHGDAELLRATAGGAYEDAGLRKAGELLAKAEAAARALGVPCGSQHAVGDRPAQVVIDAARGSGCDLIFMASHGHRNKLGMAFSSETLSVLMNSGLPVLVSSTGELPPRARAIGIIRDEHRSLAAVMHAWLQALSEACRTGTAADPARMRSIVLYLQQFPTLVHHPKEEAHLFARLRERTTRCHAELDELERQHERDAQLLAALAQQVEALAAADVQSRVAATAALHDEVSRYADFLWNHLGREEGVILPAAQRHLLAEDWLAIDAAFAQNRDPLSGTDVDTALRQLFVRIVNRSVP
jgi:nucleotide-binding universal stress UspA family protein/hemerythrin-like domain-containing protein